ncbi:DUF4870 domain-containing protein [Nonlabens mediterrranea]|uniref:DUF4870 domain-containing protein n=1 Tax=Nonlabens mediterrranea TaxID=1419947 RepID=A0ABS0A891_9FLAO|nr:conserved hypothetical protein [Flavobacteria bacterium BBFL7]MBF4985605.1 DUF4870 domain-containing protein [Nonlabens mediterrranea]
MNQNYPEYRPWGMELNQFCMFMHLSQFAGYLVPFVGIILPIVMWLTNKDQSRIVDQHGKDIVNWIISSFIYSIIGLILTCAVIGIPLLIGLAILTIVFPIIGAVKAAEGSFYKYPITIKFIA